MRKIFTETRSPFLKAIIQDNFLDGGSRTKKIPLCLALNTLEIIDKE